MSEGGYGITITVPPMIRDYLKLRQKMLGTAVKQSVIDAVIRMMENDQFGLVKQTNCSIGSTTDSTTDSIVKPILLTTPVTGEVVKKSIESTTESVVDPTTDPSASRALNYPNIYLINNKNILTIYHAGLKAVWDEFVQFKKEQRKPIKPTQLKKLWIKFGKIIDDTGVDGLIASINQTIERGYQGVFPVQEQQVTRDNTNHNAEDF